MAAAANPTRLAKQTDNICKIIIQQCTKAQLSFDTNDPAVSIGRGMIVYVCFLQGASENSIEVIAKAVLEARLCEPLETLAAGTNPSRRISPLEFIQPTNAAPDDGTDGTSNRFDVLIVPQATLTGKLKGKSMQYHGLAEKTEGFMLFSKLVETIRQQIRERTPDSAVHHGIYGARQILSMETNGPFTHVFDF